MRSMSVVAFCLAGALALGSASVGTFQQLNNSSSPVCDVTGYRPGAGPVARASNGSTFIEWGGVGDERLRLGLKIAAGVPTIGELAIRKGGGAWVTVATDAGIEFKIVEGFRRISNQQLAPLRELKVPLTRTWWTSTSGTSSGTRLST